MTATTRYVLYLAFGMLLGTLGLNYAPDTSAALSRLFSSVTIENPGTSLAAAACVPSAQLQQEKEEIFFLSCGGIY